MTEKEEGKIINAGCARGHDIHKLDMGFELFYSMQSWDSPFGASSNKEWVLLGDTQIVAFSTCKGPKLQPGDPLEVSFPEQSAGTGKGPFEVRKPWGCSKGTAEIVHFSCGEWVGQIPGDWACSLIPLIQTGNVRVDGKCQSFTPEDLYTCKQSLDLQGGQGFGSEPLGAVLPAEKRLNLASKRVQGEENEEEGTAMSDEDVNKLVGTSQSCQLPEMEPPNTLQWMMLTTFIHVGRHIMSELAFYLNVLSGEATLDFRSALQTAQGGILADAMGLRKTVMSISFILANPGRGGMDLPKVAIPSQEDPNSLSGLQLCLQEESSTQSTNQIKESKRSRSSARHGGGTHIVCRMSLLGQWKSAPDGESRDRKREVHCGSRRTVQELASGDAVAIGGVTAGGIRSSMAATITIRIRCVAVLYSFFFLFFYAHSFPCCDPQTPGYHGSSAAVRVEEERELLPFPKLSKLRVSSPRSS
ncbi:unnamed protein product [Sphagnum troendelagicum]|uniref:SNF2 N-terminal domain-containing protein n=1 Tax=Sphagnum troendelagicum TaxID=128251 RepID=A0ABP0TVW7_9BRYO